MQDELLKYVEDPSDPEANFELGLKYESSGHPSPATCFYLKAADNSPGDPVAYESLLRMYLCYSSLGGRDYTCATLLKNAIEMCPRRAEAYWLLSRFYEAKKEWVDSYLYASLGLELSVPGERMRSDVGYESEYMLLFQKAVASWWVGKPKETRRLFRRLKDEYVGVMNPAHVDMVQHNLSRLGSGPESESIVRYEKGRNKIRFGFPGSGSLERNHSQVCQDLFVLAVLGGKRDGTYLEIGSAHPFHNSNTALLEEFGWRGVGVEFKEDLAAMHREFRKNPVLNADALKLDYGKILEGLGSGVVDYLQLDIEPSKNTFEALLMVPMEDFKFRVITYEHDHYVDVTGSYREKSRRYLKAMGYTLVVNDVAPNEGSNFEDWWVRKDLVDFGVVDDIMKAADKEINIVRELMLEWKN